MDLEFGVEVTQQISRGVRTEAGHLKKKNESKNVIEKLPKVKQLTDAWETLQQKAYAIQFLFSPSRPQSIEICCNVRRVACALW